MKGCSLSPEVFADIWAINRYQVICNRTISGQWVDRVIAHGARIETIETIETCLEHHDKPKILQT